MHRSLCSNEFHSIEFTESMFGRRETKIPRTTLFHSTQTHRLRTHCVVLSILRLHRSIRLLLLKEFKKYESQSIFLSLVARHTLDKDDSIRSFCLSALQETGLSTLESVLGEEGMIDTLRRIAATPFNEMYHSLVTSLLRYVIQKSAQKQNISLAQIEEDPLLHLLSDGKSRFCLPRF